MITSLLNSGFGHAVRFIAWIENFRTIDNSRVTCLTSKTMQKFIYSNVAKYHCNIQNLYYCNSLIDKKTGHIKKVLKTSDKKLVQSLKSTSVIINDFIVNINKYKNLFSPDAVTCCLYHGDLDIKQEDIHKIADFKHLIRHTASKHDLFFHINIMPPQNIPDLACTYIPIPIMSRQLSFDVITVKKILGLKPSEEFILVHAGSAVMENVYSNLYEFYTAINQLKTDYRIVIAYSLENNKFSFRSDIIKAPLFFNGIDLVNASQLVISKPGMGILQDCIATRTPLLFLPADIAERGLKIQLLNQLLEGRLPIPRTITSSELHQCIEQCFALRDVFYQNYLKVPVNGAEIFAKAIHWLHREGKKGLPKAISNIKSLNPFMQ